MKKHHTLQRRGRQSHSQESPIRQGIQLLISTLIRKLMRKLFKKHRKKKTPGKPLANARSDIINSPKY